MPNAGHLPRKRLVLILSALGAAWLGLGVEVAGAAFPGDNGEIAFVRAFPSGRTEIYAVRSDGTGLRRLTSSNRAAKGSPVYSPNGDWIAFSERRWEGDDTEHVVVMDADGGHRRRLAAGTNPQWRAGGRQIVFDRIGSSASRRYVMRRDGSRVRLIGRHSTFGSYAPGGGKVVFSGGSGDNRGLFVKNTNGSDRRQLTRSPVYPHNAIDDFPHWEYFDVRPRFAPDARRIVFTRQAGWDAYGSGDIYTIDVDGTHLHGLTHPPGRHVDAFSDPTFSPDGRLVLFAGPGKLYTMRTDGTHRRVLFEGGGFSPDWQPLPRDH
jgi:Tol biopolymer transport system component